MADLQRLHTDPADLQAKGSYLYNTAHWNTTWAVKHLPFSLALGAGAALLIGRSAGMGLTWGAAAFLTPWLAMNIHERFIAPHTAASAISPTTK